MTKKLSKKLISIFLSLLMVLSLIPMGSMTAFASLDDGKCEICKHTESSHTQASGAAIGNSASVIGACSECGGTPACSGLAWMQAVEGTNGPLNYPEVHHCSKMTATHYTIDSIPSTGKTLKCKQYTYDAGTEEWIVGSTLKSISKTSFDNDIAVGNGKIYIASPSNDGTYIECDGDSTPTWVATIVSKADAISEDLFSEAWGATLKEYLANTDFDSLDSLVSDMEAPEYSQEGSVYTIEGETTYGNYIVAITLDEDENIASVAINYAGAYTVTFTPAPTTPEWLDTIVSKVDAVADELAHEDSGETFLLSQSLEELNASTFAELVDSLTNKEYSQADNVYTIEGNWNTEKMCINVTLDADENVASVNATLADSEGVYTDLTFTPASATCGKCTACGHNESVHNRGLDYCIICDTEDPCYTEITGVPCVLEKDHTGNHSATAPAGPDTSSWPTSYVHDGCQHSGVVHFYATGVIYGNDNGNVEGRLFYDSTSYDDMYDGSIMATAVSSFETNGAEIEGWYYWDGGFYPCSAPAGPQKMGETNTYWKLEDGVLTISGTGATPDYSYQNPVPWADKKDDITSVVIENGVTTIGNYFVSGCSKVASVTISNSVTTIGEAAFMNCKALASITLPNNLTTIGTNAFNVAGLTSVSIPNTVTSIGSGAFSFCENLTSVTLPTGITTIASYTFARCGSLTSITIPDGVTSIGGSAFSICGNLASVTFPSSLTTIGTYAFEECVKLENVTLPEGVTSIGASAFTYCSGLTNVTIPSTVTTIAGAAFRGCSNLTEITLPSSVTKIDTNAFRQCSKLASVVVNATTVPTLGDYVFKDCASDLVIYVPEESVTDYKTNWADYEDRIEAIPTAGNLCPDFSAYDDTYYGHIYIMEIDSPIISIVFYDTQQDDPTRLVLGKVGAVLTEERYKNVNEENTWYHYDKATDKYYKCSTQGEGSHPAFHKKYTLNYTGIQWLYGGSVPVYEGDKVYTAIADDGNECYAYNDGEKLEYGKGFTSVIVKIDGNSIYFCSDHTGDYGTFCDNCTPPCGLCTECGHPWAKHDPVGDCCSLCPVGDGCFDEILGEQCVLKSGHDGEHDSWYTVTDTDEINAILTKVVGEFKDAEYPDDYSIKISGNATDGFSFVYKSDGLDYNAVFVKAKQKGNEVYLEINFDIDSSTYQAGFTFKFDSQGKLTNCYQVTYEDGDVADYYAYPYTHVHTWNNGTCTLDGTTCSHTGMTTSDATCGTCGITNPSYVPPHTHNSSAYGTSARQHWTKCTDDEDNNGTPTNHTWSNGQCSVCNYTCQHSGGTATCTAAAVCSICGASYGSLASHSYNTTASTTKATDATCTAAATYYVKCDNCTSVSTTKTVSVGQPNGHSYGTTASTTKATDATCTAAATYYVKCNNCTAVDTVKTVPVGNPLGHSFATTWTSDANTHWYAATCGHDTEKSNEANHTYGTTGDARFTCTVCEAVNETKKAEAELADAKSLAKTSIGLNTIFDSNEDVEAIANQAYTDIDNATSIDDVNSIKNQAIADINAAKELAAAKADAKDELSAVFAGCEENAVLDVAANYLMAIDNAETIAEVDQIKAEGIKAIQDAMHKHSYKKTTVKPATYNSTGIAKYTCSCGDTYNETIARLKVTSTVKYNNSTKMCASFKVSSSTKDVTAKWGKVADADGYIVYAAYCGKDFKAIKTIKGADTTSYSFTKLDGKKLDLNKNFKVYVVAYKVIDGKKVEFGKSLVGHVIGGKNTKYTNPTKVTVKNSKVTLAVNKTSKISATVTYKYEGKKHISDAHAPEKRYRSSNRAVATVDKNGKITAVGKGTCTIYVFAKNGNPTKVTVTVK